MAQVPVLSSPQTCSPASSPRWRPACAATTAGSQKERLDEEARKETAMEAVADRDSPGSNRGCVSDRRDCRPPRPIRGRPRATAGPSADHAAVLPWGVCDPGTYLVRRGDSVHEGHHGLARRHYVL